MNVRPAYSQDLAGLVALDQDAHAESPRIELLRRAIDSRTCFVASDGELILGYAILEYSFYRNGFIPLLYVRPESRRQGVGTGLFRALEGHCETPKIFTSTNQSNAPMIAFLKTLGYEPSGIIHNLDPGDPELVYVRILKQSAV